MFQGQHIWWFGVSNSDIDHTSTSNSQIAELDQPTQTVVVGELQWNWLLGLDPGIRRSRRKVEQIQIQRIGCH